MSELGVGGWGVEQQQLSDLLERLTVLQRLCLADCVDLAAVPDSISRLTRLTELDPRGCTSLRALPEGLYSRTGLQLLSSPQLEEVMQQAQARRRIITKLAAEQDTMLTTLERMSWLVLLLTTATFLAFIQPPGGYNNFNVLITGPQVCQPGHNPKAAVPGSVKYVLPGLLLRNGSVIDVKPEQEGLVHPGQQCALFLFFFFDALSFCLSLGCVMMIVVLSMPRMQSADDEYEAGRFWLLLLCTWSLLYSAVAAGFAAFVCSAATVFQGWGVLTIPFSIGAALMVVGLGVMYFRFRDMFPSCAAVRKGLPFYRHKKRLVRDVETADPVLSDRFWNQLEMAVMRGTRPLSGPLSAAAAATEAAVNHLERQALLGRQGADSHSL